MERLALFCSGSGTNAQAIMDHFAGNPTVQIACLVANTPKAYALERAKLAGIPTLVFSKDQFHNTAFVDDFLHKQGVTFLVLAGFLWLVPQRLLSQYPKRVLNIHPALLPDFGGAGMYGKHVHNAVAAAGHTVSGITIHLADEAYDRGEILAQHTVALPENASAETIETEVRALELEHYPRTIEAYLQTLAGQNVTFA